MARELTVIQQEIITNLSSNGIVVSGSRTSIRRLWTYVVAFAIWTVETLFDTHKREVEDLIATKKPHGLRWYRDISLLFQYGQALNLKTGKYDNVGLDESDIEAQEIVAQSAVTEVDGKLRIKVAKTVGDDLGEFTEGELNAFSAYIETLKDAGVKIIKDSLPADALRLELDIWYNPLVLKADGGRIDGSDDTPIKTAINEFLRNLNFNGEFSNTLLTDKLQTVDGVVFPVLKSSQAKYGLFAFASIDERYIPDAGYLRVADSDLIITYKEYVQS